jgi:hypothetical protein
MAKAAAVDSDFQAAKSAVAKRLAKDGEEMPIADLVKLCETMAKLKTAESKGAGDGDGFGSAL